MANEIRNNEQGILAQQYQAMEHNIDIAGADIAPVGKRCSTITKDFLNGCATKTGNALSHLTLKVLGSLLAGLGTMHNYVPYVVTGLGTVSVSTLGTAIKRYRNQISTREVAEEMCWSLFCYGVGAGCSLAAHDKLYP
jgi:opacity protein-like surface antigen